MGYSKEVKLQKLARERKKWLEDNLKLDQTDKVDNEEIKSLLEGNEVLQKDLDGLQQEAEKMKRGSQREQRNLDAEKEEQSQLHANLDNENEASSEENKKLDVKLKELERKKEIQHKFAEKEEKVGQSA